MKSIIERVQIITHHETELINITETVQEWIKQCGVQNGMVLVMSLHTTSAITVNEGLPDLEHDIAAFIQRLVPSEDLQYHHSRYLPSDGQMAVNASSHLRSALLGFQCCFPIEQGQMVMGGRHTIYFVELDGPQSRTYILQAIGA